MGLRHFFEEAERFRVLADGGFVDGEIEEGGGIIGMIGEEGLEDADFVGSGGRNFFFLLRLGGRRILGVGRGGIRKRCGECQVDNAFQGARGMVVELHWRTEHIDAA